MVDISRRVSGRKIILSFGVVLLIFGVIIADRLIYMRKLMWSSATLKGIAASYFGCEKPIEIKEAVTGDWILGHCKPNVPEGFLRRAKSVTVSPTGCVNWSVVAWDFELHYWAERWMPFSPQIGRYVLFDDKLTKFVSADEFNSFGCP